MKQRNINDFLYVYFKIYSFCLDDDVWE